MKISKNISYREATKSNAGARLGIPNQPSEEVISNMETLAYEVFEPLRAWAGGPIKINSMYRSEDLCLAIGSKKSSQHCKGQAIDIDDTFGHKTNADMFHYIKNNLDFDQVVWEFGDDVNPDWVHVSFVSKKENRKRALRAFRSSGGVQHAAI